MGVHLVVIRKNDLLKQLIALYHDAPISGHPGILCTLALLGRDYWWPDMHPDIAQYIKGCATCQSTKPHTSQPKPPLKPIDMDPKALPFEVVAMDFITKLPKSEGNDSILTITNHDCSEAAIFVPCQETILAEGMATLYAQHVFPHYGIPRKIISNQDTRFTAKFTRELCQILGIQQNISTAYHPQIDGQSEQTNQWLEQYLRIYGNEHQNNWTRYLPITQYTHNSWKNQTTGFTPFELIIGMTPKSHQPLHIHQMPALVGRVKQVLKARWAAQKAITYTQDLMRKQSGHSSSFTPFKKGQKAWLEDTNLKTTHPTAKLAPKRYGPFQINEVISEVVYRVQIPKTWRIHDVFHASLLLPYYKTEIHRPNYLEPPPDVIEGEPEWEVEQILGTRLFGRAQKRQYRVCWKGYSPAHDS
jgi:transposase InsO family protein